MRHSSSSLVSLLGCLATVATIGVVILTANMALTRRARNVHFPVDTGSTSAIKAFAVWSGADDQCPMCDLLFGQIDLTPDGERAHIVEVRERGEPKSGTTYMFDWAGGVLIHACEYLKSMFGEASCKVELTTSEVDGLTSLQDFLLTFEPRLGRESGARCPCNNVDRVSVSITKHSKHKLPVPSSCPWAHSDTIATGEKLPCNFKDGTKPQNFDELRKCVEESPCPANDEKKLQMVIFRDPRPMGVSTYFYLKAHGRKFSTGFDGDGDNLSVDEYVIRMMPIFCQWVTIRYLLHTGHSVRESSTLFWYEDGPARPLKWHRDWLRFVGIHLPGSVVANATDAATRHNFSFKTKGGLDEHPGARKKAAKDAARRSYEDELRPETLEVLDDALRKWLHPTLLEKFGVPSL